MSLDNNYLNTILNAPHLQYYFHDDKYVFKSCQKYWIVILEKLKDTITNENRNDIIDKKTAKFRANKLKVCHIFNKFNIYSKLNRITNSYYNKNIVTYIVGEIVYPDIYDTNISAILSNGIHYYNSIIPALHLELDTLFSYTGIIMSFHANGRTHSSGNYIDGKKHGTWTEYFENGNIREKISIQYGSYEGDCEYYWSNGNIESVGKYHDHKKNGLWTYYSHSGKKMSEGTFINNLKHGLWHYYYEHTESDVIQSCGHYEDDKMISTWTYFWPNSITQSIGQYNKDLKTDTWSYYHSNGNKSSYGYYNNGNKDGQWTFWNDDNTECLSVIYSNGSEVHSNDLQHDIKVPLKIL